MDARNAQFAWESSEVHPLIRNPIIRVILLDCSESMRPYGSVARSTLNASLRRIARGPNAYRTYFTLIGFGDDATTLVPFARVSAAQPVRELPFSPRTRLTETSYAVLAACRALCYGLVLEQRDPECSISLMTDGMDNVSHHRYERLLRQLAEELQTRSFRLQLYTMGVEARSLARTLGFPTDTCVELVPSQQSVSWTMDHILRP